MLNAMLKTANGNNLNITRYEITPVFLPYSTTPIHQKIIFVRDLQVSCLLGMDFMKKARITINTYEGKIRVQPKTKEKQAKKKLIYRRPITIQPMEEAKVMAECSSSFDFVLIEGHESPELHVMDGLVQGSKGLDSFSCDVVILNLSREAQSIPKGLELGYLTDLDKADFSPIQDMLQVHQNKVQGAFKDKCECLSSSSIEGHKKSSRGLIWKAWI